MQGFMNDEKNDYVTQAAEEIFGKGKKPPKSGDLDGYSPCKEAAVLL